MGEGGTCWWGRQKVACCTLDAPAPPQPESCDYDWCTAFPDECAEEEDDAMGLSKRTVLIDGHPASLAERGSTRQTGGSLELGLNSWSSRWYKSRGLFVADLLKNVGTVAWWGISSSCDQTGVAKYTANTLSLVPQKIDVEHTVDLQVFPRFVESCVTGILPGGKLSAFPSLAVKYFNVDFGLGSLPAGLPLVSPTSPDLRNPVQRVFEAFGSNTNSGVLLLADSRMNWLKGKMMGLKTPLAGSTLSSLILSGAAGKDEDRIKWLQDIQKTIATFNYLREPEVNAVFVDVIANIRLQLYYAERYTSGGTGLVSKWDEYIAALIPTVQSLGQQFATDASLLATGLYQGLAPATTKYTQTTEALISYLAAVGSIGIPIKIKR